MSVNSFPSVHKRKLRKIKADRFFFLLSDHREPTCETQTDRPNGSKARKDGTPPTRVVDRLHRERCSEASTTSRVSPKNAPCGDFVDKVEEVAENAPKSENRGLFRTVPKRTEKQREKRQIGRICLARFCCRNKQRRRKRRPLHFTSDGNADRARKIKAFSHFTTETARMS